MAEDEDYVKQPEGKILKTNQPNAKKKKKNTNPIHMLKQLSVRGTSCNEDGLLPWDTLELLLNCQVAKTNNKL